MVRDPQKRLGSGESDAAEIKSHEFFSGLDWNLLYHGHIPPPWAPKFAGSLDTSQFDQEFTSIDPIGRVTLSSLSLLTPFAVSPDVRGAYFGSLDGAFEGFTFVDETPTQMLLSSSVQNRGAFMTAMSQRK